ncbi:ER to Golgi transport-related protein [Flagelloscypha sp. PMI_526]|nr:ER to Golgi transport-related protein [Flagelloscypha sp. PMI_526]
MDVLMKVTDTIKSLKETRLGALRSPMEFFDYQRFSRPENMNAATQRISYNTRYFSGNYGLVVAILAVYALVTNPILIISVVFLVGGFAAINRFAPEAIEAGGRTITQKHLYFALFSVGFVLLWISSPFATFFWLVGASGVIILTHASLIEPGIESEYASVEEGGAGGV